MTAGRYAAALLLACAHAQRPKAVPSASWNGHPKIPGFERAIDIVRARGRELCSSAEAVRNYDITWCADVSWQDDPFTCEGSAMLVHGCQPYDACLFQVGWHPKLADTALIEELGHFEWSQCYGLDQTGEVAGIETPAFSAWVNSVRAQLKAEGL